MYGSTRNSGDSLLVDHDEGTVIQCPPNGVVSRRYVDTHPFIELVRGGEVLVMGPDAPVAARRGSGDDLDVIIYKVNGEEPAGFLRVTREV